MKITRNPSSNRNELRLTVSETAAGRDFDFSMSRHHIATTPGARSKAGAGWTVEISPGCDDQDWHACLTENEQLALFNMILGQYRKYSLDSDKFKAAAIAVVQNPDPDAPPSKRHLLFIGVNTERAAKAYFKDCAEQNTINTAVNSVAQHQGNRHGEENLKPALIKEMWVMAGSKKVPIACPCGKCTDALAIAMEPGGKVVVLPANNGDMPLTYDTTSTTLEQIRPKTAWKTTIDHLASNRTVELIEAEEVAAGKRGLLKAITIAKQYALSGDAGVLQNFDNLPPDMAQLGALLRKPEASLDGDERFALKTATIALNNLRTGRQSVAELEAALGEDGVVDGFRMDQYMQRRLSMAFADRMLRAHESKDINLFLQSDAQLLDWCVADKTINSIECAVLQFSDGRFYAALDADTKYDNAYPNPEVLALGQAMQSLGNEGVTAIFGKSLNPANIEAGRMHTSNKEALERSLKRRASSVGAENTPFSTADMRYTYSPFHDGQASRAQVMDSQYRYTYTADQIYPGRFGGVQLANLLTRVANEYAGEGPEAGAKTAPSHEGRA